MPGALFHVGATAMCSHGGQANALVGNPRVLVGGMPVAVLTTQTVVAGCVPPSTPPCTLVQWTVAAARVQAGGVPVLLQSSIGLGLNPAPAGPVTVVATQTRVIGT